jgi:hypothetical protein
MSVQTAIKKVTLEFLHAELNERLDKIEEKMNRSKESADQRFDQIEARIDRNKESVDHRFDQIYALLTQILLSSKPNK